MGSAASSTSTVPTTLASQATHQSLYSDTKYDNTSTSIQQKQSITTNLKITTEHLDTHTESKPKYQHDYTQDGWIMPSTPSPKTWKVATSRK